MVHVSQETEEQTEARLLQVVKSARLTVHDGVYAFEEFPLVDFPTRARPDALALVRDDQVWSQLVPSQGLGEPFRVFRLHFAPDADNSGFVGWLATRLKRAFGTGVFVTCGMNSNDGGVFDYWGVPVSVADPVIAHVVQLNAR